MYILSTQMEADELESIIGGLVVLPEGITSKEAYDTVLLVGESPVLSKWLLGEKMTEDDLQSLLSHVSSKGTNPIQSYLLSIEAKANYEQFFPLRKVLPSPSATKYVTKNIGGRLDVLFGAKPLVGYKDEYNDEEVQIVYEGVGHTMLEYYEMHTLLKDMKGPRLNEAIVFTNLLRTSSARRTSRMTVMDLYDDSSYSLSNFVLIQDPKGKTTQDLIVSHYFAYKACVASGFDTVGCRSHTKPEDILLFVHLLASWMSGVESVTLLGFQSEDIKVAFSKSDTPRRFIQLCEQHTGLTESVVEDML